MSDDLRASGGAPAGREDDGGSDIFRFIDVAEAISRRAPFLVVFTAAIAVGASLVSLALPSWYVSQATVFGPEEVTESRRLMTSLRTLSIPGARPNIGAQSPETFLAILESRSLREAVIERLDLIKGFRAKSMNEALRLLRRRVVVQIENTGIVSVTVEDRDRERAAQIANAMIDELDRMNVEVRIYKARRARQHLETQIADVRGRLLASEDSLARFQQENLAVSIDAQARVAVDAAATLQAKAMELRIKKGLLESYATPSNPDLISLSREIDEIERQLQRLELGGGEEMSFASLPALSLRFGQLLRDVRVGEALLALLTEDYEEARLDEAKETPVVQVLDRAVPAERRSRPKRAMIVVSACAIGFLVGVAYSVAAERYSTLVSAADNERWSRIIRRTSGWLTRKTRDA